MHTIEYMEPSSLDPFPRFRYTTLVDPTRHIRLIQVHQPDSAFHIPSVSIFETQIDRAENGFQAPLYDAISYTWGDNQQEERILIRHRNVENNNRPETLSVRKNCADVLRQLAHFKTSKQYWIDAICINQEDKAEREKQVLLMGNIFGRARCVLACVGMHHSDSSFLARVLGDFDGYLATGNASSGTLTVSIPNHRTLATFSKSDTEDASKAECIRLLFRWIEQIDAVIFERFFRALDQLARRPYFWRVWILQELCLADQIRIFCGDSELSLSTLLLWWRDVRHLWMNSCNLRNSRINVAMGYLLSLKKLGSSYMEEALWLNAQYLHDHGGSGLGSAFEDMLYERQITRLRSQDFNRRLMAIPDILKMCEYRQCGDSRDCVYGTLALGNWRPSISLCKGGYHVHVGGTIQPDYNKSAFEIAKSLLPGFHDVPQLARFAMGMLGLNYSDPYIQYGLKMRYQTLTDTTSLGRLPPRRITNDAQELVHIVEGGIELTHESRWSIRKQTIGSQTYVQVLDASSQCCAVTTTSIKPGDWLVPTHYGRGFVLRQSGTLYAVVGKAYCPPDLWPDEIELTAFMMWYDPNDLLIHLVGGLRGLAEDQIDPPSIEMVEHLNIKLCATENSSFGQLPLRRRTWPASEYTYDTLGNCEAIVRDCYEDNERFWFY